MRNSTGYLGLDVHAETVTAAIAEGRGKIRSLGKFPNRAEGVRTLLGRLDERAGTVTGASYRSDRCK